MTLPQRIEKNAGAEQMQAFVDRWRVSCELAERIHLLADVLPWPVQMVSGYRTPSEQTALPDGAPVDISTHTSCPATGADLQVIGYTKASAPTDVRRVFGASVRSAGMRWGGGSRVDPETGFPVDWNHVDLGPRVR